MIEVVMIRHGETDWNAEKRLQGHLDIELNAEGLRQADMLAQVLQGEQFDAIVCSDLQRARKTAQPLASLLGKTVHIDKAWRERCYGAFEGLRYAEIGERFPDAHKAMQARELDYRYPQGVNTAETLREFYTRSVAALKHALDYPGLRKIAIVTHGGVLDCINRFARGSDLSHPRDFDIPNAAINRLWWKNGELRIAQWADIAHLTSSVLDEVDR
jgi:probable phosphoglycerate mutase